MEDLSVTLKKQFFGLYKQKHEVGTVENRVVKMKEQRKVTRREEMFENRNIPLNMSPFVTPAPKRERTPTKKPQVINKRLEMLAKWKEDKEKRKQLEKKTLKPVFKVSHIPINVGLPNLEKVNLEIKGKPFKSKFAPPNHQFKPPSNIKPIHFNNSTVNSVTVQEKTKKEPAHRMTTRSQTKCNSGCSKDIPTGKEKSKKTTKPASKQKKREDKENKATENNPVDDKKTVTTEISFMSPDFPVQKGASGSESDDQKTPKKIEPPVYVSPFVTISRGKDSARKEYEARKSRKSFSIKPDIDSCTSPKAGAAYFTWLLNAQISRLQELCDQWNKYKEDEELPDEAISMIDVAIGQTNLLLTKKFAQFRGLIDKCGDKDCETPVTCEDLHGFWDMIHLQVHNLDKRFENLENLKVNNWQEILPVVKKEVVRRKGRTLKNAKPSAGLKEAILAARRKKQGEDQEEIFIEKKTPQSRRNSSRLVVVKTTEKNRNSSPGLMMMKVAQFAKSVETPAKSILKTDTQKSVKTVKSQSKTVLFRDQLNNSIEDVENDLNKTNLESKSKTPTRRSTRLTKSKLF